MSRQRVATILLALLVASPIPFVFHVQEAPADLPSVQEAQQQILPLFEESAAIVDPEYRLMPRSGSSSYEVPFSVAGDPFGYDRCDSWWNLFRPGWNTSIYKPFYAVTNLSESVAKISDLWARDGGQVTLSGGTRDRLASKIVYESAAVTFVLRADFTAQVLELTAGTTDCLPVN